jgi:hypothetical protein
MIVIIEICACIPKGTILIFSDGASSEFIEQWAITSYKVRSDCWVELDYGDNCPEDILPRELLFIGWRKVIFPK